MQTITTKYHQPSSVKGSRISATATNGKRVICHEAPELSLDQNHDTAAVELCLTLGWAGPLFKVDNGGAGYLYSLEAPQVVTFTPKAQQCERCETSQNLTVYTVERAPSTAKHAETLCSACVRAVRLTGQTVVTGTMIFTH